MFYEGEEVADEHNGLRFLFAEHPELVAGDLAILLEPTGGWLEAGCQGTIHIRAAFEGARAAHGPPVDGRQRDPPRDAGPRALRRRSNPRSWTSTVSSTARRSRSCASSGGVANNVVPDACELVVNRRIAPSRTIEHAISDCYELLGDADTLEVLSASAPAPPNLSHPLVQELIGAGVLGVRPKLGMDRRCTVRRARDRRVQLRPG